MHMLLRSVFMWIKMNNTFLVFLSITFVAMCLHTVRTDSKHNMDTSIEVTSLHK